MLAKSTLRPYASSSTTTNRKPRSAVQIVTARILTRACVRLDPVQLRYTLLRAPSSCAKGMPRHVYKNTSFDQRCSDNIPLSAAYLIDSSKLAKILPYIICKTKNEKRKYEGRQILAASLLLCPPSAPYSHGSVKKTGKAQACTRITFKWTSEGSPNT